MSDITVTVGNRQIVKCGMLRITHDISYVEFEHDGDKLRIPLLLKPRARDHRGEPIGRPEPNELGAERDAYHTLGGLKLYVRLDTIAKHKPDNNPPEFFLSYELLSDERPDNEVPHYAQAGVVVSRSPDSLFAMVRR